jgi:hypothetical protein
MKTNIIALPVALAIAFTPLAASAQVCGIGIIVAAMVANTQQHRELTQTEAASCGLMLNQDPQNVKKAKRAHAVKHRTVAPQKKKQG